MEPSLASYLAQSHKHVVGASATLPSKHCKFSTSQLEKVYLLQVITAHGLSSVTMLQIYQAMFLAELRETSNSSQVPLLNKIRIAMDHILCVSCCVALSWGRRMASTVVAQRQLWLTLSDIPEKVQAIYLDEPVLAAGLFGQSLDVIQMKFELRKKFTEDLSSIIPRCCTKPKKPANSPRRSVPSHPPKRSAPGVGLPTFSQ